MVSTWQDDAKIITLLKQLIGLLSYYDLLLTLTESSLLFLDFINKSKQIENWLDYNTYKH